MNSAVEGNLLRLILIYECFLSKTTYYRIHVLKEK